MSLRPLLLLSFEHPDILAFGLQDLPTQRTRRKGSVSTDNGSPHIEGGQQDECSTHLTAGTAHVHLGQDHAFLREGGGKQMHALAFSQRDHAFQGFPIETEVSLSCLGHRSQIAPKELIRHLLPFLWIDGLSHDPAPRAGMGHVRLPEREQPLQFSAAQFDPVCQSPAACLSCQFGQHADQQALGQRVWFALFPTLTITQIGGESKVGERINGTKACS